MTKRSSDAMTHSNYDAKMDELLAAVDRLESKNNLSLMATAAMQSAMRAQSAKIEQMRDRVLEMESTVSDLKVAVNSMCRNIVTLAAIVGVPP
jgi:hypothetical protein